MSEKSDGLIINAHHGKSFIIEMEKSFNCCVLSTSNMTSFPFPILSGNGGKFVNINDKIIALDDLVVGYLREFMCPNVDVSVMRELKLWKVNVDEDEIKNDFNEVDIREKLEGCEMKPQRLFKKYFENELAKADVAKAGDDKSAENIHIITIIPATTGTIGESSILTKRPNEFQSSNRGNVSPHEVDFWNKLSRAQIIFKLPDNADEARYNRQPLSDYMEVEGNEILLSENILVNSQDELIFNDGTPVLIEESKITIDYVKFLRLRKSPDGIVSGIKTRDILIKKSYLQMIEKIEHDRIYEDQEGCTIIGSPGIGKTHFSLYIAFYITRRYSEDFIYQQPVERSTRTLHINQQNKSVIQYPSGLGGEYLPDSFYIADSVAPNLLCKMKYKFLVTTPKNDRWHEFVKEYPGIYYAPIWTEEEIWNVWNWNNKYKTKISEPRVRELIKRWGCIPRRIFIEHKHEPDLNYIISRCNAHSYIKNEGGDLSDDYTGKAIHIIPNSDFTDRDYLPASTEICEALYRRYENHAKHIIIEVIRDFAGGCGGTFAGNFFEMLAHDVLRKGGTFRIRRLTDDNRICPEENLDLQGLEFNRYNDVQEITSGYYNFPRIKNFESVDAIAPQCNGIHNLYQITIASKHDTKVNGLSRLKDHLGGNLPIHLYFVVPDINHIFDNFHFQNYVTTGGGKYKGWNATTGWVRDNIEQYVLEIKLQTF